MTTAMLYVVRGAIGLRKIGQTMDTQKRIWALQSWNVLNDPGPMVLEHVAACPADLLVPAERHAHTLVWDKRIRTDWFDVDMDAARAAVDEAARVAEAGGPFRIPPPPPIKRTTLFMPMDLYDAVVDYRFEQRCQSVNDAILDLVRAGLDASRA
jgi:hypothetical protein